ncbi:MAG: anhydro-N-acetylmuramic acid kinase [Anaerolineae bacterium]|nr:anhydro-N-acetylmuramic acid kinase [Anaerolineae bacterium]NUQ07402.1 anhydro-N-acetylmuramic acid kinase [Anaerolineae bacterium]
MLRVIGLISGTSADGIDAALCEIDGAPPRLTARIVRAETLPYPPVLRDRVLIAMQPGKAGADALCKLNFEVGTAFAAAAQTIAAGEAVDLVGSHGQTVWHQVEPDGRVSATLQIGEGSVIAEALGVTVISNLRARDVAAGGQGAPLVSYLDWLLLRHDHLWRAVQNIGGIGNVTFLPPLSDSAARLVAFDTGPGNALIDSAMALLSGGAQHFDRDGALGALGTPDDAWLAALLAHPYYAMQPPKTTGRELFGTGYAAGLIEAGRARGLNDADLIASITALTARSIAAAYRDFAPAPIGEIVIGGGGRHNPTLIGMIRAAVGAPVRFSDDLGIDSDSKEALLFALLAYESWHDRIGTLPEQTGARHGSVLGQITPGANHLDLLRRTHCR